MTGIPVTHPFEAEDAVHASGAAPRDAAASGTDTEFGHGPRQMLPRIRIDVFVGSGELGTVANRVARDRRAVRTQIEVHEGGFQEAIARYRDQSPPNLIVVEDHGAPDTLEWNIEALAECCPPTTHLTVIGSRNDIALYRRLTQIGVSDYLVQPIRPLDLLDSIVSIFSEAEDKELGLVLAFVGTRGGAGASTIAHNVAATIGKSLHATTLLIDADLFGTAALQFDFTKPQGFLDAIREGENLDKEMLDRLIHWRDKQLGILAAPDRPDGNLTPDAASLRHLVEQARRLTQFVILDLPHGWTPWIAEALSASDRIALVATPDLPSLRNCRALTDMILKLRPNDAPPEIVLNRMPARGKPPVLAADYERILGRRMAAVIPYDVATAEAEMSGRVLVEDTPRSATAAALGALARQMAGRDETTERKAAPKGLFKRLLGKAAG